MSLGRYSPSPRSIIAYIQRKLGYAPAERNSLYLKGNFLNFFFSSDFNFVKDSVAFKTFVKNILAGRIFNNSTAPHFKALSDTLVIPSSSNRYFLYKHIYLNGFFFDDVHH